MEKAIAIVVTYNRLALLTECIEALRAQSRPLDAILVVNNGSTDGTEDWLRTQQDLFYINQQNVGSSGGFYSGIRWAFEHAYSWVWCMDDDGFPAPNALEKLLEPETAALCLRNCAVINKEDRQRFVWRTGNFKTIDEAKGHIIEGVGHPFNGTLLHRNIIERVGLPKPALFLWGDETEYFNRIVHLNHIPVITVADSIHYHPSAAFSIKRDWDYEHAWKMYYYVRNRLFMLRSRWNSRLLALIHYLFFLIAMVGVVFVFQKTDRIRKLAFLFWPAFDALSFNFKARPASILQRLQLANPIQVRHSFGTYLRHGWQALVAQLTLPPAREHAVMQATP